MSSIRLNNVGKVFGGLAVVRDVDLSIADGEFAVLVGPSGCGKSTLLRMIAGLEEISSGELWIGDKLANRLPPQRRNISMVFQSYALFPHMLVKDNIGFGPRIRGEPLASIAEKVARAAGILNLSAYLERLPRQLSGGQRQRVAMGRSIVRDPHVFLFDEPLSNLDAKLRVQMRAEIKTLHRRLGSTIVYVTHDQIEAMTMADRIVVMNAGQVEQVGGPLDLYDRPASRFVASFLGSPAMSFVPATAEHRDGEVSVRGTAGQVLAKLPTAVAGAARDGQPIDLGMRPEDLRLSDDQDGMPFSVEVVEPTGAETHLVGSVDGAPVRCVFRERLNIAPGDTMRLRVDPARLHLFDRETGLRL